MAAAGEDAFGTAIGIERTAELAARGCPLRIDEGRLKQPAHARAAIGIAGADLVGGDPAAPRIGFWRVARVSVFVLIFLARRLSALDQEPAVLEADDAEFGEPAAFGRVLGAAH